MNRYDRRACLLGEKSHAGLELLDPAVRRAAAFRKQHQVPARLEQLARAVQLALRATRPGEGKRVQEQTDDVAKDRVLEPVIGGGGDDGAVTGGVGERVEDERSVGVARVIRRKDHRPLELAYPLPALDL